MPPFVIRFIIFLQSSTAVFLAALPTPPLLKITGRVTYSQLLINDFKLTTFAICGKNNVIVTLKSASVNKASFVMKHAKLTGKKELTLSVLLF